MKTSIRILVLVWAAFLLLTLMPLRAQEAQQKPQSSEPQPSQSAQPTNPNSAVSRELVEASKAAEGEPEEKGENEGLKHSVAVKWMAQKFGISVETAYWIAMFFNFAIVFVLIGWLMKSSLPGYFRSRTQQIQRGITEARAASEDAQRRLKDIETRLAKLDTEVAQIRASAETESAAEEVRIRAAAEADVKRVLESAEQEIDATGRQARRDLKGLAAKLAVDLAERKLQIDAATDEALVRNFVAQLGKDGQ